MAGMIVEGPSAPPGELASLSRVTCYKLFFFLFNSFLKKRSLSEILPRSRVVQSNNFCQSCVVLSCHLCLWLGCGEVDVVLHGSVKSTGKCVHTPACVQGTNISGGVHPQCDSFLSKGNEVKIRWGNDTVGNDNEPHLKIL